ncbi:MAG: hypothetical protein DRI56_05880 [Chloroflexota bacterium]|nr:MAG: hypothetical protein DRI56_05880 [Chloroflexota bacterium]
MGVNTGVGVNVGVNVSVGVFVIVGTCVKIGPGWNGVLVGWDSWLGSASARIAVVATAAP